MQQDGEQRHEWQPMRAGPVPCIGMDWTDAWELAERPDTSPAARSCCRGGATGSRIWSNRIDERSGQIANEIDGAIAKRAIIQRLVRALGPTGKTAHL